MEHHPHPDWLAAALVQGGERLGPLRHDVTWYAEVDSTNDLAVARADAGHAEFVVAADAQHRGRGRRGRTWFSPPGSGLYVSVVLRPAPGALALVPLAAGLAVAEGIEASTGLSVGVKWPNDVYVPATAGIGRKVAGVLVEAAGSAPFPAHVVVGFGVNVLHAVLPSELRHRGTSLEDELGRRVDRGLVLAECLAALWNRHRDLHEGRAPAVLDAWRARAVQTLGRRVEWDVDGRVLAGTAAGIDASGALLIATKDGLTRAVAGEVRWE